MIRQSRKVGTYKEDSQILPLVDPSVVKISTPTYVDGFQTSKIDFIVALYDIFPKNIIIKQWMI